MIDAPSAIHQEQYDELFGIHRFRQITLPMYPAEDRQPHESRPRRRRLLRIARRAAVDSALAEDGTSIVVLNSVCGCAAGSTAPA